MRLPKLRFTKMYRLRDYNFTLVVLIAILSVLGIFVVGSARRFIKEDRFSALWLDSQLCLLFL